MAIITKRELKARIQENNENKEQAIELHNKLLQQYENNDIMLKKRLQELTDEEN